MICFENEETRSRFTIFLFYTILKILWNEMNQFLRMFFGYSSSIYFISESICYGKYSEKNSSNWFIWFHDFFFGLDFLKIFWLTVKN